MHEKIVITAIFEARHAHLLYSSQHIFNCTPFVSLMALLNCTIIIVVADIANGICENKKDWLPVLEGI